MLAGYALHAQTDSTAMIRPDSLPPVPVDSAVVDLKAVKLSSEGLDDIIDYGSRDSMWFDVKNKQLHLWGAAYVKYTALDIKAGYILMDYSKNEISAQMFPDSTGQLAGAPEFNDGEQAFSAEKLRYNFKSKKGIIYQARTKQEDLYVLGEKAKFVGSSADTTGTAENVIYNSDALITTCDDPHPHFGIRTNKLKVIPNKLVVTGLSNLELGGIPTPLILPFGFFPITKTRKAGLIIPRDFEFADQEGLGVKDWGWYQPISDHMDLTLKFNAYVSGSFGALADFRYNYKYKYTGNFNLNFNNRVTEDSQAKKVSAKSFGLRWSHNQDAKAHPTRKFGGSVNIQTNRDQQRNRNDFNSVYQNTLTSNLTFSKTFPGKPFAFNASLSHSQNTQTRLMNITLPNAAFTVQRIYPFKRKIQLTKERWYEKISLTYNAKLQNSFQATDTTLFTQQTLNTARMGIQHQANTDFTFKLFKYINVAPRINYEENWYPYTIEKRLLDQIKYKIDTTFEGTTPVEFVIDSAKTVWGVDTTYRDWGLNSFRKFDVGVSVNTALFLTKQFKKGWFRGIRHTVKPSASIGVGPDYSKYFRTYDTSLRPGLENPRTYSIYDDGIFGRPTNGRRDVILNYSLVNVLEMKFFSAKRDTVLRKRIFDNLAFSGSYNFSVDSFQWSPISTGGLFRLFKGVTNLSWNASFDPYVLDANGRRQDRLLIKEEGRLLRVSTFSMALNTGGSLKQIRGLFSGKDNAATVRSPAGQQSDVFVDWFDNFRINHRISLDRRIISGTNRDTFLIGTNNISISGDIPLSSKWAINIGNIAYDFPSKQMVFPDIGFTRDLHCWQLSMRWQPTRGTYEVFIGVKPGSLDFVKMPYRKNNFDGRSVF
ncbi:MAG: LPS-assembly protein LptD [Lewinellaceae bacterium]|nr:LPS-assembly protein LptD [Lewinellaceae bacterium]